MQDRYKIVSIAIFICVVSWATSIVLFSKFAEGVSYWTCTHYKCVQGVCQEITDPYQYATQNECNSACYDECTPGATTEAGYCSDGLDNDCDGVKDSEDCDCDTTPPSVSVSGAPANWQNSDATASVSCSDSNCGCDSSTYRLKIYSYNPGQCPTTYSSYTLSSPQTISSHSWVCGAAKDYNGNVGFSSPVEFKVDKIEPTTTINPNGHGWTNQDVSFTLTCTDSGGSGCDTTYYKIINDGGGCGTTGYTAGTSGTVSCPSGSVCKKRVCYYSVDNAGNQENVKMSNIFYIDKTSPSCSVTSISESSAYEYVSGTKIWYNNDGHTGSFTVSVSASDTGSGVDRVVFPTTVSNGGADTTSPYSWSYSFDSSDTYDSSATVTVYDVAGNSNTCNFAVDRDVASPSTSASATSPPGEGAYTFGTWTRNDVRVSLSASDAGTGWGSASGVDKTYYCYYDTTKGGTCSYTQYSSKFTITCASDDTCAYKLNYYSIDRVSNREGTNSRDVLIDKQKPRVTVQVIPDPARSDSTVTLRVTCDDKWKYGVGSGCDTTDVTQDLQPYVSCSFNGDTTHDCVYDTPSCTYAYYTYTVTSADNVGNSETVTGTFVVKKADGCPCTFDEECYSGLCVNGVCTGGIERPGYPELFAQPQVDVVLGTHSRVSVKIKNANMVPDVIIVHLDVKPNVPWSHWLYFTGQKYEDQSHALRLSFEPEEEKIVHFTIEANQLTYANPVEVNITAESQNFKLVSEPVQMKINVVDSEAEPAYPGVPGISEIQLFFMGLIAAMYILLLRHE